MATTACSQSLTSYVYIDDYNTIERLNLANAPSHISTNKKEIQVLAAKSEIQFDNVQRLAKPINMRVNEKKTQLLCVHTNPYCNVTSYIRTGDNNEIRSSKQLKILGFYFDSQANTTNHVLVVINNFYKKTVGFKIFKKKWNAKKPIAESLLYHG